MKRRSSIALVDEPSLALAKAITFLREIGLHVVIEPGASGFLPLIDIRLGVLYVDPDAPVSNLLHEAGHLAILPNFCRSRAGSDPNDVARDAYESIQALDLHPDHPVVRALIQASDPEATAWAWAAGMAIGLRPEEIILDSEYDGDGAEVRCQVSMGAHAGIHGMMHAGLCNRPRREGGYPKMLKWLQDAEV